MRTPERTLTVHVANGVVVGFAMGVHASQFAGVEAFVLTVGERLPDGLTVTEATT